MVDVASCAKFAIPCNERRDPGVVVPMPRKELALSHVREFEFERADDDVQNATLFCCPPERPLTHDPVPSLKHPPDNWMPFANVEVADVDVILMRFDANPPSNVDVEFVPLTSMKPRRVDVAFVFDVVMKSVSNPPSMSMFPVICVEVPVPAMERVWVSVFFAMSRFPAIVDVPVPWTMMRFDVVMVARVWDPVMVISLGMSSSLMLNEFDPEKVAFFI